VAEIEQTRTEMASTIDAIRDKLDPATLTQQAKDSLREATIGRAQEAVGNAVDTAKEAVSNAVDIAKEAVSDAMDTARDAVRRPVRAVRETSSTLMDTIRENPVPAAMIGIGLGWLVMSAQRNSERNRWRDPNYDPDYDYRYSDTESTGYYSGRYESRGGGYYYGDAEQHHERPRMIEKARERIGFLAGLAYGDDEKGLNDLGIGVLEGEKASKLGQREEKEEEREREETEGKNSREMNMKQG